MKQRVITACSLLALLFLVVWQINTPLITVVVAFFAAIAANEIINCAKIKNKFLLIGGTAIAALIPFFSNASALEPFVKAEYWDGVVNYVPLTVYLSALVMAYFIAMLADYAHTKFEDVAITVVASVFVPWAFSILIKLRDVAGYKTQFGTLLIFYAFICAMGTDMGAQLTGMKFGKHKMSPNISPKKTWEGAIGGIIVGFILNVVAIVLYNCFAGKPLETKVIVILLIASPFLQVLSMAGDLSASVLKRNFDVKDFGKIFPGHGGVMDRFDSSMFTLPITYALALFILN